MIPLLLYLKWPVFALKSPLNPKSSFVHHLLHFLFLCSFCFRSPEASAEPVPPSPGRWSQDLLGGLDRYEKKAFSPTQAPNAELCEELSFHQ